MLLVEGDDDAHAIRNLLGQHGISAAFVEKAGSRRSIAPKQVESVDDFPPSIRNELKVGPDLSALGVVADADQSVEDEWRALRNALHTYEDQRAPISLPSDGWIGMVSTVDDHEIPAGIWIMPDNDREGALEEFVMELVPDDDGLWPYSEEVIQDLPEQRFSDADEGKALIHTWLAWQETPREPIGRAISQDVLRSDADLAAQFVDWVQRFFPAIEAER